MKHFSAKTFHFLLWFNLIELTSQVNNDLEAEPSGCRTGKILDGFIFVKSNLKAWFFISLISDYKINEFSFNLKVLLRDFLLRAPPSYLCSRWVALDQVCHTEEPPLWGTVSEGTAFWQKGPSLIGWQSTHHMTKVSQKPKETRVEPGEQRGSNQNIKHDKINTFNWLVYETEQ